MASGLLSLAGWTFLPDLITGYLQTFYYGLTIRAGERKPQPGSPEFVKHRRRIQTLVILSYLLYTIYEADWEIRRAGNFYTNLGVSFDVDERRLNTRFRKLTLEFHPDKIKDQTKLRQAEAHYIHLKVARDTLLEPARRWAYDRFGPDAAQWRQCVTHLDFVTKGLQSTLPYYVGSIGVMIVMGMLGYLNRGRYWRYLAFASLAVYEISTVTSPSSPYAPPLLPIPLPIHYLMPFLPSALRDRYLSFEWLKILHKSVIAFFIALERLGPLLDASQGSSDSGPEAALEQQLLRLERAVKMTSIEVTRQQMLELVPFLPSSTQVPRRSDDQFDATRVDDNGQGTNEEERIEGGQLMNTLRHRVKDWLIQNTIRNDPKVQQAMHAVMQERRAQQDAAYARTHGRPA